MSEIVMTASDFVAKVKKIQSNYKTVYCWGSFGFPLTDRNIDRVAKQYKSIYTETEKERLRKLAKSGQYFMFDCVGLIKGVLWGFSGNSNNDNGGCKYCGNGVNDLDCNDMYTMCNNKREGSSAFTNVKPGEFLWRQGHIGVAIGDGLGIECTPSWNGGVQITRIKGGGNENTRYPIREWTGHGKSPFLDFSDSVSNQKGQNGIKPSQSNDRRVGKVFQSVGVAAKRSKPSTNSTISGRCERGLYYPVSEIVAGDNGIDWLKHTGSELYSSRVDTTTGNDLFKMHGTYSEVKTNANCRVRSAYGLNGSIITTLPPGETVYWTGATYPKNGYVWAEIIFNGKICYCDEQWLSI